MEWLELITGADIYQPFMRALNQDAAMTVLFVAFGLIATVASLARGLCMLLRSDEGLHFGSQGRLLYGISVTFQGIFLAVFVLTIFWPAYRLLLIALALFAGAAVPTAVLTVKAVYFRR